MKKASKRLSKISSEFANFVDCSPSQAISLLKKSSSTKFIETVEAHIHLNINTKYSDQQLRSTIILPNGTGKEKRVAVLLTVDDISKEIEEKADLVGEDELIEEINSGSINFDVLLTVPSMMQKVAKLGRILGPRGLMPTPKAGTVVEINELINTINDFKKGKIEYRADKSGIVHTGFGKLSFTEDQLLENLHALYNSILVNKPKGVKGKYLKTFYVCNTMSPSLKIDINQLETIV